MSWDDTGIIFVACFMAVFFGVALFEWLRAEYDERKWRKILAEEMHSDDMPRRYRLVIEDRSDSE